MKEVRGYFRWFIDVLPSRIKELSRCVKASPGFESWQPDYLPDSLGPLGEWFASQVELRKRTKEEVDRMTKGLKYPIPVADEALTVLSIAVVIDVGMYLSQVFIRCFPALRWEQCLGSRNNVNFGHAVLVGFGRVPMNPVRLVEVRAYEAARSRYSKGLMEIYEYWSKQVKV